MEKTINIAADGTVIVWTPAKFASIKEAMASFEEPAADEDEDDEKPKRGRKAKAAPAEKPKRGRKAKAEPEEEEDEEEEDEEEEDEEEEDEEEAPKRGKGKSAKKADPDEDDDEQSEDDDEEDEDSSSKKTLRITPELKEAKRLRDVINILLKQGFKSRRDITAACVKLQPKLKVLKDIQDLEIRVPRAIEILNPKIK